MSFRPRPLVVIAALASVLFLAKPLLAQWQITGDDGKTSIKFGYLVQMRGESLDVGDDTAQNLFFRRLRLLAGGKLSDQLSFFFETDSPNLGKANNAGVKDAGDIFIQDFVITYAWSKDQNIDAGMLLPALSHNGNQSAVSLMATDYGQYSFLASGPTTSRVGRDYGVRARGYVMGDKLEYRAGVYQGARGTNASNEFRFVGRLVFNVFQPEKGLYYTGTTLGKKRILSFGASIDHQDDYDTTGLDIFYDQPLPGGNGFTVQADWNELDGGNFLTSLPQQDAILVEAGYYNAATKLMPFVQYSKRDFDNPAAADQDKVQVGLGWMFGGFNRNLKLSVAQISTDGGDDQTEVWLNFQVFKF